MWVLGAKPRSSGKAVIALLCRAISPALGVPLVACMVFLHIPILDYLKQISDILSFHPKCFGVYLSKVKSKSNPHHHYIIIMYLCLITQATFTWNSSCMFNTIWPRVSISHLYLELKKSDCFSCLKTRLIIF